ncbi:hypothetical protein GCM10027174_05160 [Salinifilum aidingensis]
MSSGSEPGWDGDLFRLYHKRLGADSWQDDFADAAEAGGSESDVDAYGRALFGGPGADLFGSGSGADDGATAAPGLDEGFGQGPPSVSMPSVSQSMMPLGQSGSGGPPEVSQPGTGSGSLPPVNEFQPSPDELEDGGGSLVRPYARTRGRTRTEYELAIETLVTTSESGRAQNTPVKPEHRTISELCVQARSVAEVSAHLRLPLGVVRVLIGDMAGLGLVLIHDGGMVVGDRPSLDFLERVLSGLRRL